MGDMDADLNIEGDNETIELNNFPIREYVAAICEKDPEKCWPFASICDMNFKHKDKVALAPRPAGTVSLFSLNVPQDTEAYEMSNEEIPKGKEAVSESPTAFDQEISKGNDAATALEVEAPNRNEVASEIATENANSIISKFTADVEDDSDDLTLTAHLRKRKGVEIILGSRASTKKQKKHQLRKPRLKGVKRPNPGPEGSPMKTMKGKSPVDTHNYFAMEKLAATLSSVELETALAKCKSSGVPLKDVSGWRGGLLPIASGAGETKGIGMAMATTLPYGTIPA